MLIFTRRVTQQIRIGDEITIAILGVKGNSVRIGIEAPKNVAVDREEVYVKKALEIERASVQILKV